MKIYNINRYLLVAGFYMGISPSVFAVDDHAARQSSHQTVNDHRRILIDPDTQQLTLPSGKPLSKVMQNSLSRSAKGLEEKKLRKGAVALNLQGRFMHMATATKDKANTTKLQCDTNINNLVASSNKETAQENNYEK